MPPATDFLAVIDSRLLLGIPAALVAVLAVRYGMALAQLLRLRLEAAREVVLAPSRLPSAVRAVLDLAQPRLAALGFERRHALAIWTGVVAARRRPLFADVYAHRERPCFARVLTAEEPEPGALHAVEFLTCCPDGRLLLTMDRRRHMLPALPEELVIEDGYLGDLDAQWRLHLARKDVAAAGDALDDPAEVWRCLQRLQASYINALERDSAARPAQTPGIWRLTLRGAWRILRALNAGAARAAKSRPPDADEPPRALALADAFAYSRAVAGETPPRWFGKLLLFGASAGVAALALGLTWSWLTVPVLLAVLLLHELGHVAAMRATGHRDLNVLFIPFLGAAATGRKEGASVWQRVLVDLAGPVPGLIVGAACVYFAFDVSGLWRALLLQAGLLSLALNLLNLLPFLPLDGGRVVDTLLLARRPWLRLGFALASSVLLLGAGFVLQAPVLGLAGALLAFTLPGDWRIARLLAALRQRGAVRLDGKHALRAVFEALARERSARRGGFRARMTLAGAVLPLLSQRRPRVRELALGFALYGAALAVPAGIYLALQPEFYVVSADMAAEAPDAAGAGPSAAGRIEDGGAAPARDWETELAQATDPDARWMILFDAGRWQREQGDAAGARAWLERALAAAAGFPPGDIRTAQTRVELAAVVEDQGRARRLYDEALPVLRQGGAGDQVASALEGLHALERQAPPAQQIQRVREALDLRQGAAEPDPVGIDRDRRELAWLLDAGGDARAAEELLRRRLAVADGQRSMLPGAYRDLAWYLLSHRRSGEAESLILQGAGQAAGPALDELSIALAWARMQQGKHDEAAATLEALWERQGDPSRAPLAGWLAVDLSLDLAAFPTERGDEAAVEAWLDKARAALDALPPQFAAGARTTRYPALAAQGRDWQSLRWQALAAVSARL